jgi:hypothetical protein
VSAPKLVVGAEGVSRVDPSGTYTVRYDECTGALAWPDGARQLVGVDGISVRVEPALYRNLGTPVVAEIDNAVGPERAVPMPTRTRDEFPVPQRHGPRLREPRSSRARFLMLYAIPIAVTAVTTYFFVAMANAWRPAALRTRRWWACCSSSRSL